MQLCADYDDVLNSNVYIDEWGVWDRKLTLAEITDHMNNGPSIVTPPTGNLTITLEYPVNQTHYSLFDINESKLFNGSLVTTTNLNATCTVATIISDVWFPSNTWNNVTVATTRQHYTNYTSIKEGNYSVGINCTDGTNNASTNFWFIIDNTNASITVNSPLNNTFQTSNFYVNSN